MTDARFNAIDWRAWMRDFGHQQRRAREFLGMSQEQLARMAGVSQGAVSRLEAGRGLATPMLVILKINLVVGALLKGLNPDLLTDDLRRAIAHQESISPPVGDAGFSANPIMRDERLASLIQAYQRVPDGRRDAFVSVVVATSAALSTLGPRPGDVKEVPSLHGPGAIR